MDNTVKIAMAVLLVIACCYNPVLGNDAMKDIAIIIPSGATCELKFVSADIYRFNISSSTSTILLLQADENQKAVIDQHTADPLIINAIPLDKEQNTKLTGSPENRPVYLIKRIFYNNRLIYYVAGNRDKSGKIQTVSRELTYIITDLITGCFKLLTIFGK